MARIAGINIPQNKIVSIALTYIHGIGPYSSKKICEKLDEKIPKSTSYKSQIKYVEDRPGHDLRYAINNKKIKNKIGWRPSLSFDSGLDLTIEWYLKNTEWWEDLYKNKIFIERQGIIR